MLSSITLALDAADESRASSETDLSDTYLMGDDLRVLLGMPNLWVLEVRECKDFRFF